MGTHSDGEDMGITKLELLRVLLPRNCEYCTGWMRPDPDDPGEFVCANCGRGTFHVDDPVALSRQKDNEGHVHGHRDLVVRRSSKARDVGLPQGALNVITRRFA